MCEYRTGCNGRMMYQGYSNGEFHYQCDEPSCGHLYSVQGTFIEPAKPKQKSDDDE